MAHPNGSSRILLLSSWPQGTETTWIMCTLCCLSDKSLVDMVTAPLPDHVRAKQSELITIKGLRALRRIRNCKMQEILPATSKGTFKRKRTITTRMLPNSFKVKVMIPGGNSMHIEMLWPEDRRLWPAVKLRTSQIEHSVRYIRYFGCKKSIWKRTCKRPTRSV